MSEIADWSSKVTYHTGARVRTMYGEATFDGERFVLDGVHEETITLPVEDVHRLCECNRELMEHLQSVDKSCTASMYGREYVDKAWAKVAVKLPPKKGGAS